MNKPLVLRHSTLHSDKPYLDTHRIEVYAHGRDPYNCVNTSDVSFRLDPCTVPISKKKPKVNFSYIGECTPDEAEAQAQTILEAVRIARAGWDQIMQIQSYEDYVKDHPE